MYLIILLSYFWVLAAAMPLDALATPVPGNTTVVLQGRAPVATTQFLVCGSTAQQNSGLTNCGFLAIYTQGTFTQKVAWRGYGTVACAYQGLTTHRNNNAFAFDPVNFANGGAVIYNLSPEPETRSQVALGKPSQDIPGSNANVRSYCAVNFPNLSPIDPSSSFLDIWNNVTPLY